MSVALLILKIIGIVLLVLLGLILLLILSVLFVPVRYRIRGSSEPQLSVNAALRWLFPAVGFSIRYQDQRLTQSLRILGIPIPLGKSKDRPSPGKEKGAAQKQELQKPEEELPEIRQQKPESEPQQSEAGDPAMTAGEQPEAGKGRKRSRTGKIRAFFLKVKSLPRMIKKKVAKLKEMALRIYREIKDEANRNVLRIFLRELKTLAGHYLPRRLKADVQFGMADPAATGQLLGALALFPIFLRPGVRIVPDFTAEKIYVKGSFEMSGRVRIIHVITAALRLWREPDVKHLIQRVRNRR